RKIKRSKDQKIAGFASSYRDQREQAPSPQKRSACPGDVLPNQVFLMTQPRFYSLDGIGRAFKNRGNGLHVSVVETQKQ
ncbi:hypothetical protein, partial [Pseudomonas brassicacearum]|uniref:hypothetical protein n=1 Tax=Pseudomonas brassicacearum TaxID=930166 RepID=UPI001C2F1C16